MVKSGEWVGLTDFSSVCFESSSSTGRVDSLNMPYGTLGRWCGHLRYVRRGIARKLLILTLQLVTSFCGACRSLCHPCPLAPHPFQRRHHLFGVLNCHALLAWFWAYLHHWRHLALSTLIWWFHSPSMLLRCSCSCKLGTAKRVIVSSANH